MERLDKIEIKKAVLVVIILTIMGMVSVSGETIIAGNNYTFQINITDNLFWNVTGNSSDMIGFEVYQDVYDDYSDITFTTDYRMKPDIFTIMLFSNKTEEIIKEVEVPSGGGSAARRRRLEQSIQNETIVDIIDINQTDEEPPIIEEKDNKIIFWIIISIISLVIICIVYLIIKKLKYKKIENETN